jgi:hypothetical protein
MTILVILFIYPRKNVIRYHMTLFAIFSVVLTLSPNDMKHTHGVEHEQLEYNDLMLKTFHVSCKHMLK